MKQVEAVRSIVIQELVDMRQRIGLLPDFETEAITALGGIPFTHPDALAQVANAVLEQLGHPRSQAQQPRFDKTVRAVNKQARRPRHNGRARL